MVANILKYKVTKKVTLVNLEIYQAKKVLKILIFFIFLLCGSIIAISHKS